MCVVHAEKVASSAAQRVVISGAAGVLGHAVARAFVAAGARVAFVDRMSQPKDFEKQFGAPHVFAGDIDLSELVQAQRVMSAVAEQFGGIDVLVNIAGGFRWETLADGSVDTWDFLYNINLRTVVCASRAALPHLKTNSGRIISIGAAAAAKAGAGMGAYTASKAGVVKLTEALSEELKERGINVNAVLPSIIDTPANRAAMPDADFTRWVTPVELANVILFLASDGARAITGASIPVTGRV